MIPETCLPVATHAPERTFLALIPGAVDLAGVDRAVASEDPKGFLGT